MPSAPLPPNERERLCSLIKCGILDTEPESTFDDLTQLVARLCDVPIALVSLVDAERQWFKSAFGLCESETPRDWAFCAHAILQDDPFIITDATKDPRTRDNPLVTGPPNIRFYAGVPMRTADGYALGTLCVIDKVPRKLSDAQLRDLKTCSRQASALLESSKRESELTIARAKAEGANRSKSEFLVNMSHEIRTPMTAILGYADALLEENTFDRQQHLDALRTIKRNGEHLLTIINDILDTSKIESGQMEVESIATRPLEIVEQVISLLKQPATSKGLSLECRCESSLPEEILSDPTRLRQILLNLLGNSIKFTEEGSVTVRLSFASQNGVGQMRVAVTDTGIGMTQEQVERVCRFGAFTQADGSTTRRFGGSGLGLRISNSLARMLGGQIEVRSTTNQGSTFTLSIESRLARGATMMTQEQATARIGEAATTHQPIESSRETPLEGLRILLAEDGPDNQKLISFLLMHAGAEVTVAENGRVALERLTEDSTVDGALDLSPSCDLILMDMQMPEVDGYRATELLRAKGSRLPIVALTAHATTGEREKCLAAGCDDYATKPIDRVALIETVLRWAKPLVKTAPLC